MIIALTTRWNAGRHSIGETMVEEILNMGFTHIELGYDLRACLIEGVTRMVKQGNVKVDSIHNYCPIPFGGTHGHPEIYTFAHSDPRIRENAVIHTLNTINFAAEIGAKIVVTHCGYVEMRRNTKQLLRIIRKYDTQSDKFDRAKDRLQSEREKKAGRYLNFLTQALEKLIPTLEATGVTLALENLPTWEAMPNEAEMLHLKSLFPSPHIKYWHDMGHGQIRENLGLINAERWLQRLKDHLAGMHVHDVSPPFHDHLMPSQGELDFSRYNRFAHADIIKVIEPTPHTEARDIIMGLNYLREIWGPSQ